MDKSQAEVIMDESYSLFVFRVLRERKGDGSCKGIIVRSNTTECLPIKVDRPVIGWVNGNPIMPITWHLNPVFRDPVGDQYRENNMRNVSLSMHSFSITDVDSEVPLPFFANPAPNLIPIKYDCEIMLQNQSYFETSGFQSYFWSSTVGHILYDDLFLPPCHSTIELARSKRINTGDCVPFVCEDQKTTGIAVIGASVSENIFQSSIFVPSNQHVVINGIRLLSKETIKFNCVEATFSSLLGIVQNISNNEQLL